MKVLLGTCFALALAAASPAFADQDATSGPQQLGAQAGSEAGSQADTDMTTAGEQGQDQARPRHHRGDRQARHGRHNQRQYTAGERVKPKLLRGRHVVTDYSRFGVQAPRNGDVWIKAHRQLMLVSADGVVKTIVARPKHHRYRSDMQGDRSGPPQGGPAYRGGDQGGDQSGDQEDDQGAYEQDDSQQ